MRADSRASLAATIVVSAAYLVLGTLPEVPGPLVSTPDTLTHFLGYCLLAALAARAAADLDLPRPAAWGWAWAVAHGGLLEALQSLVPERRAELSDLLCDALGALAGVALASLVRRRR